MIGTNVGNLAEFQAMVAFVAEHRIEPVIDRRFDLADSKAALAYLEDGHGFGKVVIGVGA